jgi:hypothetical protein
MALVFNGSAADNMVGLRETINAHSTPYVTHTSDKEESD